MKQYLAVMMVVLGLAACAAQPAADTTAGLTSSLWELTNWSGHEIPHGDNGEPVILNFQDNGKEASVSGRAWCNRFTAPYVLREGRRLTIGHAAATRMACMSKAMEFESAFLDKLQALDRYKIEGDSLKLFAVDGEVMMLQARKKEAAPSSGASGK
ncbi:META domain-containing protein [Herbaspirillum rhizosphaerae]|uniref:META domain-containing protein n=1 Tax=Herbaspirillum rhizosphaerae TaxID=346179 RepID=A0ABW8Z7D3_9BURK